MGTPPGTDRTGESRNREVRRRPELDKKWTPRIEEAILEVIAKTGSPRQAAAMTNVSESTIQDHRKRDLGFRQKYAAALETCFHSVLGRGFERALEQEKPSDRLIEVLLKLRWPERLSKYLAPAIGGQGGGGGGLNPLIIARMDPDDRTQLVNLLSKYLEMEGDAALDGRKPYYDLADLPCVEDVEDAQLS